MGDPAIKKLGKTAGGEVADMIKQMTGQSFTCTCNNKIEFNGKFDAYLHDAGYKDKDGNKWWLFITCKKCQYQWALWKILRRLERMREEKYGR